MRLFLLLLALAFTGMAAAQCLSGDCVDGRGEYLFPSGARYVGEFREGAMHGTGTCYYPDGSVYVGQWADKYPHGYGIKRWADGTEWKGQWIKGQPGLRHTPVIMQTGDTGADHVRAGIERGAFYYLTKPFHERLLRSVVAAAISDHAHRRSLLRRLAASEDVFTLMVEGTFRFRTLAALRLGALRSHEGESPPLVGLSELLFNAVEHGNLGITYDEKTRLLAEGRWEAEVARRLALPEQARRFGEVRVRRMPGRLELVIADQGPGFDYARFLELDEQRVFDNHGRGIAMARLELDLEYIDPGNRVCVRLPVPG